MAINNGIQDGFIGNLRNANAATTKKETKETKSEPSKQNNGEFFSKARDAVKEVVSKAKTNSGRKSEKQKLNDFIESYRSASKETKEAVQSRLKADSVANDFITRFRDADEYTQRRIANKLRDGSEESAGVMNKLLSSVEPGFQGPSGEFFNKRPEPQVPQQPQQPQELQEPQGPTMQAPKEPEGPQGASQEDSGTDVVEYTYKPGDTFGRVLMKIGLSDGRNLWGDNGDVAYYTKQLVDQGFWPSGQPGNIPVGSTIRLRRRGWENQTPAKNTPMVPDAVTGKMISAERRA